MTRALSSSPLPQLLLLYLLFLPLITLNMMVRGSIRTQSLRVAAFLRPSSSYIPQDIVKRNFVRPPTTTQPFYSIRARQPLKASTLINNNEDELAVDNRAGGEKAGKGNRKSKNWDGPLAYHQELEVRVDSLTNLGLGVCRLEEPEGWVVMVPTVIPGEKVRVRVYRNHRNYSEADLLEVIEPSPERQTPQCKLFGVCGGCQYQHMTIDAQREWKRSHVLEVLTKLGGMKDPVVQPVQGTQHIYGYRTKLTPHYDKPRRGEIREIGFLKWGSRQLVDVDQCPIATEAINMRLPGLREETREKVRRWAREEEEAAARGEEEVGKKKKKRRVLGANLLLRDTDQGVITDTRAEVSQRVTDLTFKFQAGEFFQNNAQVLPVMLKYVVDEACRPLPKPQSKLRYLVDAYCGGGLFSLACSKKFEACFGIEISEAAVLSARRNAELNAIHNCHFLPGDASNIFGNIAHFPSDETVVIIDPPRRGCDEDFLNQLFRYGPIRVVYVSCDPATQARDARVLVEQGGYEVEAVQPFDMFPQTRHIENVITFRRGADWRREEPQ